MEGGEGRERRRRGGKEEVWKGAGRGRCEREGEGEKRCEKEGGGREKVWKGGLAFKSSS